MTDTNMGEAMTDTLPKPDTASRIMAALDALNEKHGRGKLLAVDYENRTFTRRELRGNIITKQYTLSPCNSMVNACGHWRTI